MELNKKYKVKIHGKEIEIEQLPNGKFKKPNFVKNLRSGYAGLQPKPALEVILVVMKPLSEKSFVDQALKNGKGITWLDYCRIPHNEELKLTNRNERNSITWKDGSGFKNEENNVASANPKGRFPANLLVSDSSLNEYSKYFDLDQWYAQFIITPKASASERNKGCEHLPEKTMSDLDKLGGSKYGMKTGSGNDRKLKHHNNHPTVKPIKLMSYLVTLGSNENDIIIDPFVGSGTTCIAAYQLNRRFIGIEKEKEYYKIATTRLNSYMQQTRLSELEK